MALILGPIVGHTDAQSSRIWIRVDDDPAAYAVRISGTGIFPFLSTESEVELGTAVAIVDGLRADWPYIYHVLRGDRWVPGSHGVFRTMPRDEDPRGISFATISCNSNTELGSWPDLRSYVFTGVPPSGGRSLRAERPRFLLMVGDQVYIDNKIESRGFGENVWEDYFYQSPVQRRAAIARWYQDNWGRRELRDVMANIPTYMMWDDHDIRDGWGALAHDSPTIAARYPENAHLHTTYREIFEDFRTVFWHFQRSHGPAPGSIPAPGERRTFPALFRVGRVLILMIDSRGDRDLFRDEAAKPALGQDQWNFINAVLENVPPSVDHLILTTAAPIAHYSKYGIAQHHVAGYPAYTTYDIRAFRGGRYIGGDGELWGDGLIPRNLRMPIKAVRGIVTNVRDQWPHHYTRQEQEELIRAASRAQFVNRTNGQPRSLVFVAGDVHLGGDYRITVRQPTDSRSKSACQCFFSSGIGKKIADDNLERPGTVISVQHRFRTKRKFSVAKGIKSKVKSTEWRMNFGIIQVDHISNLEKDKPTLRTSLQSTQPFSKRKSVARKQKRG